MRYFLRTTKKAGPRRLYQAYNGKKPLFGTPKAEFTSRDEADIVRRHLALLGTELEVVSDDDLRREREERKAREGPV
jgi:hypothetical protein